MLVAAIDLGACTLAVRLCGADIVLEMAMPPMHLVQRRRASFAPARRSEAGERTPVNALWQRMATGIGRSRPHEAIGDVAGLRVGAADDSAEADAERISDQVMRTPRDAPRPIAAPLGSASEGAETNAASRVLGAGRPLPDSERAFFEPRFGRSLEHVRLHDGSRADQTATAIAARAFTLGNHVAFARGEWRPGTPDGRRLIAHELAHVGQAQTGAGAGAIRRALKFELQIKNNKVYAWDGGSSAWALPRKFGPADYLVEDPSGVRLESETGGQLEFETEWERKWPKMEAQIKQAQQMVNDIRAAPDVAVGGVKHKTFPFNIDHLRAKKWKVPKGKKFETNDPKDKALSSKHQLVVEEKDPDWKAYIQTSESFSLDQFESFFSEYESDTYDKSTPEKPQKIATSPADISAAIIGYTDQIIADINTEKLPDASLVELHNFLTMVISYIFRGQYPARSPAGHATKFAFSTMSRTHFGSIYTTLLNEKQQALFKAFVKNSETLLLDKFSLTKASKFFVHGQGTSSNAINPTIGEWLASIVKGKDLLSSLHSAGKLSGSMGRFRADKEKGKHEQLIRYEVRVTPGNSALAKDWATHAKARFDSAFRDRNRPGTTTELEK
jgi:hypothetical protein